MKPTLEKDVRKLSGAPQTDRWSLRQGDAWDLASTIEPNSVDLILTSPPYWGLRTYGQEHNNDVLGEWNAGEGAVGGIPSYEWYRTHGGVLGLEPYPAWYVAHLVSIFDRLGPSLVQSGSLWINLGDTYFARWASIRDEGRQGLGKGTRQRRKTPTGGILHDKQLLMVPARFAIAMQDQGWILRNDAIWNKPHVPPRPEKDRLRLSHEHFFHFVRRNPKGRPTYFYDLGAAETGALDVLTVSPDRTGGDHSATFPLELIVPRIRSSSPVDGLVVDPFAGTGSTLVAALSEGRRALGFELSAGYARRAEARLMLLNIATT